MDFGDNGDLCTTFGEDIPKFGENRLFFWRICEHIDFVAMYTQGYPILISNGVQRRENYRKHAKEQSFVREKAEHEEV